MKDREILKVELKKSYFYDLNQVLQSAKTGKDISDAAVVTASKSESEGDDIANASASSSHCIPVNWRIKNLNGEEKDLRDALAGKVTLLLLSFRAYAQPGIESWMTPFLRHFGSNENVQCLQVSIIEGWGLGLLRSTIEGSLRSSVPRERHPFYFTMKATSSEVIRDQHTLQLPNRLVANVLLLDEMTRIHWRATGVAHPEYLHQLMDLTSKLLLPSQENTHSLSPKQ